MPNAYKTKTPETRPGLYALVRPGPSDDDALKDGVDPKGRGNEYHRLRHGRRPTNKYRGTKAHRGYARACAGFGGVEIVKKVDC